MQGLVFIVSDRVGHMYVYGDEGVSARYPSGRGLEFMATFTIDINTGMAGSDVLKAKTLAFYGPSYRRPRHCICTIFDFALDSDSPYIQHSHSIAEHHIG